MKSLALFFFCLSFSIGFSEIDEEAEPFLLFAGNSSKALVSEISNELGVPVSPMLVSRFNDGEIRVNILKNVRNKEVFIVNSTCSTTDSSINDVLMELYLTIRTLKRSSVKSITAVIPYFGYARQDRKTSSGVPISASDIAMLLERAGVDRVLMIDLHCGQIQGFFHDIAVDNLYSTAIFIPYLVQLNLDNIVIVSPDAGGVDRAKKFKEALEKTGFKASLAMIIKERAAPGEISQVTLVGNVEGCNVIIVDDICDTAGTLVEAAKKLKEFGAKRIFTCITHPVFSGPALQRIAASEIDEMIVTDTIPLKGIMPRNVTQISSARLLAEAIMRIHAGKSIADLFHVSDFCYQQNGDSYLLTLELCQH